MIVVNPYVGIIQIRYIRSGLVHSPLSRSTSSLSIMILTQFSIECNRNMNNSYV